MQYIWSSDGLVGENAILEIKCPYAAKDTLNAVEVVEMKMVINITHIIVYTIYMKLNINPKKCKICY